jgi:Holliday junction resolvase
MTDLNQPQILIEKASGEREVFSSDKLRRSLEKAGASPTIIDKITDHVLKELKNGDKTSDIYKHAFLILSENERPTAGRYHLKQALMELGPTGHPFEKFVGELLKAQGFSVEVGTIVEGACVTHEVDVTAQKDNHHIMVECKFHNQPGVKSDVKVALYVQARFEDVAKKFHEAWLVTNTKLTTDAIRYATCVGMTAIGWSYPQDSSLEHLIEQFNLHPLTCLTTLNDTQKRLLLDQGFILCKDIVDNPRALGTNAKQIIQEAKELCNL